MDNSAGKMKVSPMKTRSPSAGALSLSEAPQLPTAGALNTIIQMPYPRMPQIALSRDEVAHIIAYILSLKR